MEDSHVFLDRRQHKLSPLRCRPASARASANPHFVLSSLRESCTCDISGPCFFSCNLGGRQKTEPRACSAAPGLEAVAGVCCHDVEPLAATGSFPSPPTGALVQETVIHMVRFKNRYMLFDVSWKDGKFDDSISERLCSGRSCQQACKRAEAHRRMLVRHAGLHHILTLRPLQMRACCWRRSATACSSTLATTAWAPPSRRSKARHWASAARARAACTARCRYRRQGPSLTVGARNSHLSAVQSSITTPCQASAWCAAAGTSTAR